MATTVEHLGIRSRGQARAEQSLATQSTAVSASVSHFPLAAVDPTQRHPNGVGSQGNSSHAHCRLQPTCVEGVGFMGKAESPMSCTRKFDWTGRAWAET